MKKAWRRFLAGICTVSLLMTSTGVSVMADEDESIFTDLSEDVSVIEISDDGTIKIVRDGSSITAEAY